MARAHYNARRCLRLLLLLPIGGGCTHTDVASPTTIRAVTHSKTVPSFDAKTVGYDVILTGRCHRPLGQVMTVTGIVVDGPDKGYEGGPNMIVQRIDGIATQEYIRVPIMRSTFEQAEVHQPNSRDRMLFIPEKTYQLHVFETGVFTGTPPGGDDGIAIQTTRYYLQTQLEPTFAAQPIRVDPITFAPGDFVDRNALITGTAENNRECGYVVSKTWEILSADDSSPWPDWMVGKPVEVEGVVRRGANGSYRIEGAARRLSALADQIGHPVELRGILECHWATDTWYFNYRGEQIILPHFEQPKDWHVNGYREPCIIRGTLTATTAATKPDGESAVRYEIRDARWEASRPLRSIEQPGREE